VNTELSQGQETLAASTVGRGMQAMIDAVTGVYSEVGGKVFLVDVGRSIKDTELFIPVPLDNQQTFGENPR